MKPIILKMSIDGKVLITADEIKKIVDDAYEQGLVDGMAQRESLRWTNRDIVVTCKSPEVYL